MSWISSSPSNPCPVCSRTKDSDCVWADDLLTVLCHTPCSPNSEVPQPYIQRNWLKHTI